MEPEPDPSAPRRVEAYLDQVLAPLARCLSAFQREELRRELKAHLWERVTGYRELGQTEEEAVTEALRQFGGAEDFLRQWHREWIQTTPQATLREMGAATRCALLLSFPALLITFPGSPNWLPKPSLGGWGPEWMKFWFAYAATGWGSFLLDFIVIPIVLGLMVGRLTPKYAGVGMLAALAAEVVLTDPFTLSLTAFPVGRFWQDVFFQVFICSTTWLPLACTVAILTSRWTTRSHTYRLV